MPNSSNIIVTGIRCKKFGKNILHSGNFIKSWLATIATFINIHITFAGGNDSKMNVLQTKV